MPDYGSTTAVKQLIQASTASTFDAAEEARIAALLKTVSRLIEHETGRTFGTGATAESVVVAAPGVSDVLVLPKGVRAVTSVTVDPAWNGSGWTGGTVLVPADYRPVYIDRTGEALALQSANGGYWYGTVLVAGTWADTDADSSVPDDITYVANRIVAEVFKAEKASGAGTLGPDGVGLIPLKNMFKDPIVVKTLDHWRIVGSVVV